MNRPVMVALVAMALLAGCGGTQNALSLAPSSATPHVAHVSHNTSWMLPEAMGEDLLYVDDPDESTISVYDYENHNLVGTLDPSSNRLAGECLDRSEDVYVTGGPGVLEYAHGGSEPKRKITDAYGDPYACSVDGSGYVAIANFSGSDALQPGNVSIYGRDTINVYSTPAIARYSACGYDPRGDLLVGGWTNNTGSRGVAFALLPKGGSKLIDVSLGATQTWPFVEAIQ